jgi:threonine/homoserine/homoserine lactone efflux protein
MLALATAFLPFAVVAAFTPGPNNLLLAASGANFGIRRTIPHLLGVMCGFPLLVLAVGLGLGSVFQRHPDVHTVLKFVGATFLIYLAWRIATAGSTATDTGPGRPLTFLQAALFQWVNPKA